MQYEVSVLGNKICVEQSQNGWIINDALQDWDIQAIDERRFHLLHNHQSFTAEILHVNRNEKTVSLKINNQLVSIALKDRFDLLLHQMGMSTAGSSKLNDLKAPMPGLVVKLLVDIGATVHKGDGLLILEAMKMENVIKADGTGTVKDIKVSAGTKVEKGELLIQFT
jgi:biotin carboxyl carrier protein